MVTALPARYWQGIGCRSFPQSRDILPNRYGNNAGILLAEVLVHSNAHLCIDPGLLLKEAALLNITDSLVEFLHAGKLTIEMR